VLLKIKGHSVIKEKLIIRLFYENDNNNNNNNFNLCMSNKNHSKSQILLTLRCFKSLITISR